MWYDEIYKLSSNGDISIDIEDALGWKHSSSGVEKYLIYIPEPPVESPVEETAQAILNVKPPSISYSEIQALQSKIKFPADLGYSTVLLPEEMWVIHRPSQLGYIQLSFANFLNDKKNPPDWLFIFHSPDECYKNLNIVKATK
jgi:hypothetical protein